MTKITNIDDFKNITSRITSFSHAYLLNVNSLDSAFPYAKEFAKAIILENIEKDSFEYEDISYKIDNNEFDDLYVVNPETIGINNEEISKLMSYMETKSLRENGRRVYIIYGLERLSSVISNKILKFLEEPEENIYAILMSENYEKLLPTIVSRCQVLNLSFDISLDDPIKIDNMKAFLKSLLTKKKQMIAYEYDYFSDSLTDRIALYQNFEILEKIISESLNSLFIKEEYKYRIEEMGFYPENTLINILNITNKLKCLIKNNINLNLLIDRYIIEVAEELELCKK